MAMRSLSTDRIGGLIWIVFGGAVVYGSWTMDRLQSLGIPPSTAPGVVPGLLGLGIILFGLILVIRREGRPVASFAHEHGLPAEAAAPDADEFHWKRAALSGVLCLTYGGALLGRGPALSGGPGSAGQRAQPQLDPSGQTVEHHRAHLHGSGDEAPL